MKVDELTLNVKTDLTVDKKTAEVCLKLVELYVNHNDVMVLVDKKEDGSLEFHFENKGVWLCQKLINQKKELTMLKLIN